MKAKEYPKLQFAGSYYLQQQSMHDSPARFKVGAFGRQSGKSFYGKREALERAANEHQQVMIVFPALSAARTHWREMVRMLKKSNYPGLTIRQASKEIEFPGGGYISIRSAQEPENLRGGTLDFIVLDEAAFYPDGENIWWTICMPQITASGGDALIISTPNGKNWFYRLWLLGQKHDTYYQSWSMPSWESPFQDTVLLEHTKRHMPDLRYREEYGAEFLGSQGGVFMGSDLVATVKMLSEPASDGVYAAGVDWGDTTDYTVFSVFDIYTREQVYLDQFTGLGAGETVDRVYDLIRKWHPKITNIEKNGIGETCIGLLREKLAGRKVSLDDARASRVPGEQHIEMHGGYAIRPVHMDNTTKRAIIERLATDIQYKDCWLLEAGDELSIGGLQQAQMSTMLRTRTKSGQEVTYKAQEGEHDDLPMGTALAYRGVPRPLRIKPARTENITTNHGVKANPFRSHRRRTNARSNKVFPTHR